MANLPEHFARAVARHPDRVAIIDGQGRKTTYRALSDRAKALAGAWARKGISPGDRVLLALPVDADLYASLAALWSLGATVVLPEPAMGLAGLRHAARTTAPKAFCAAGLYRLLKLLLPQLWTKPLLSTAARPGPSTPAHPAPEDTALISFTSGTTGAPKAIPRSHAFLMAQHDAIAPLLDSPAEDIDLVAFPVFVLINLAAGRTSVLPSWKMKHLARLHADQVHVWITRHGVTRALIPPYLAELLGSRPLPQSLTTVFTGGGPVFPDIVARLHPARVVSVYGSTEAEPIAHLDARDVTQADQTAMAEGRGLLVGHPVPAIRLRIEDHEIQVAGDHVNDRYLDPAHMHGNKIPDGDLIWHRTGDTGRLDSKGRLWLWGRLGSEIATDTGPLFPFAVELAARAWPGVAQAALMAQSGQPLLVLQGTPPDSTTWNAAAQAIGIARIKQVPKIPMDRRHNSKVDRNALARLI